MRAKPGFLQTRLYEKQRCPWVFSNHHTFLWGAYQIPMNVHEKLVSRKKEILFCFPISNQTFYSHHSSFKVQRILRKISIISCKINSHQNRYKLYAEDNKKHCLLHSIPQFISFHFFLTFKCPPPSQEHLCHLSIHIYAYQSKISVWGKWMISSLSNKPFHSKIFLSLSLSFLSSSRNCFPPELEWVCAKYQYKSCYLMNVQWQARSTEEN